MLQDFTLHLVVKLLVSLISTTLCWPYVLSGITEEVTVGLFYIFLGNCRIYSLQPTSPVFDESKLCPSLPSSGYFSHELWEKGPLLNGLLTKSEHRGPLIYVQYQTLKCNLKTSKGSNQTASVKVFSRLSRKRFRLPYFHRLICGNNRRRNNTALPNLYACRQF